MAWKSQGSEHATVHGSGVHRSGPLWRNQEWSSDLCLLEGRSDSLLPIFTVLHECPKMKQWFVQILFLKTLTSGIKRK